MFKSILSFALTLLAFSAMLTAANTDDPQGDFISDTDALLKRYVKQGRVDYVGLKASNDLDPLIQKVATVDLSVLKGNDKKAFLINAYNLLVIKQVLTDIDNIKSSSTAWY